MKKRTYRYHPLWKRLGCAVAAGVLVVSMSPASFALADTATTSVQGTNSSQQQGTPPAKPDGDASGQPPAMPGGGAGGGANTQSFDYNGSYTAAKTADGSEQTSDDETISATEKDQNVALAQNGGTLTITGGTLQKSGDDSDSADNTNFYGTNSGVLAVGKKSQVNVSGSAIATSSAGSNGIFATDSATVYANDDSITTTSTEGNARGLDATYGGTIIGNKLAVSTQGNHCAALATDRGGGNVSVANSTLATAGSGSPLLYSTGDIEVENVSGTASGSQIAGMEGYNSIYVSNSTLESTNDAISGSDPIKNGVIIYQSTSGDAETSTGKAARFEAVDSTLKSSITSGSMFYFTNTSANVVLKNTKLAFESSKVNLLIAQGNASNNWGSAGSNGASVNFTLDGETVSGNITADDISTAKVWLVNGTKWTGAASVSANSASSKKTSKTPLTVNVGADSTWVVTGDSTVTNLNVANGGKVVDSNGKTVTIKTGGKTVVKGTSSVTVTVTDDYSTKVKTTSASKVQGASIDRSGFDKQYGTTTTFGKNAADESSRGSTVTATTASTSDGTGSGSSEGSSESDPLAAFFDSIAKALGISD